MTHLRGASGVATRPSQDCCSRPWPMLAQSSQIWAMMAMSSRTLGRAERRECSPWASRSLSVQLSTNLARCSLPTRCDVTGPEIAVGPVARRCASECPGRRWPDSAGSDARCTRHVRMAGVHRFGFRNVELARVGPFLLLAGNTAAYRDRVATILVGALTPVITAIEAAGGQVIEGPAPAPNGNRLIARHPDGAVFEYIEAVLARERLLIPAVGTPGNRGRQDWPAAQEGEQVSVGPVLERRGKIGPKRARTARRGPWRSQP